VIEKMPTRVPGTRISLKVHPVDNVATLLDYDVTGNRLADGTTLSSNIPFGHKVALCAINAGAPVIKYGITIGLAITPIASGEHVHVHNVA
jgi:altronate hydrolase